MATFSLSMAFSGGGSSAETPRFRGVSCTRIGRKRLVGGQGGIRTRGGCYTTHAFQACALNHSATCPYSARGTYSAVPAGGNGIFPPRQGSGTLFVHWGPGEL